MHPLVNTLSSSRRKALVLAIWAASVGIPVTALHAQTKNSPAPKTDGVPWGAAMVGLDVSGASSVDAKAVFLGQALMDFPLSNRTDPLTQNWIPWMMGQLRIAGMAQPGTLSGNIGSLSAFTTYLSAADNATPDKIVQSVEANLGLGIQVSSYDVGQLGKVTGSIMASAGAVTPLSADQSNPPVYSLTNQILQQYAGQIQGTNVSSCAYTTTPTCYVAFIPQDRTHFYRHYEAGYRLKAYEASSGTYQTYPGNLDIMIGQNEYVTRGKLSGFVLHIGGMIPIPGASYIYGYGSMDTTLSGESLQNDAEQLLLSPAPSSANLTYLSPSVYTVSVSQPKRDRYQFGFGIDVYHLVQAAKKQ